MLSPKVFSKGQGRRTLQLVRNKTATLSHGRRNKQRPNTYSIDNIQ